MKKFLFLLLFIPFLVQAQSTARLKQLGLKFNKQNMSVYNGQIMSEGRSLEGLTVTTIATADSDSYTAAELLGGLILRDPNGGTVLDTLPTASSIVGVIYHANAGASFLTIVENTANGAETLKFTGNTGTSFAGVDSVNQNETAILLTRLVTVGTSDSVAVRNIGNLAN